MKKIILVLFAICLYICPVRASQEVELTSSQWEDLISMYEDLLGVNSNASDCLLMLISYFSHFASTNSALSGTVSFYDFSTNIIKKLQSLKNTNSNIEGMVSDIAYGVIGPEIASINYNSQDLLRYMFYLTSTYPQNMLDADALDLFNLQNFSTNHIALLRQLQQYVRNSDKTLLDLLSVFRLLGEDEEIPSNIYNIPQYANTYSNMLARYLQAYTNKLESSYSIISNALYKSSPWVGNSALWKMHLEEQYDFTPLSSFGSELPSSSLIYSNPDAAYMQYILALQNATGYNSFNNLIGTTTAGGLVGYWNYDIPGVQFANGMKEDAKSFFSAGNWADKNFDELRNQFERNFGVKIEDAAERLEDVFKRNEIIRDAALAGNIKPMADNLQRIADSLASNTNEDILVEMNQNISNVVIAINALEGFVFPESVISNLDELVNREDEYETTWRNFYSPNSVYNIQSAVDNLEQEYRHAETKVSEISNKVQRTVATLSPETSGLNRFLQKVKNYTQRNVVLNMPENIQILDTEEINRFLRYHSDRIQFPQNAYYINTNYEIYGGVRISDIIEGIRDLCKIFYAGMGLYFGFKLTMIFLVFMSRTVQYLGIYLNIKALQIK